MAACEKVATTIVHEFNNILATMTYSAELASYDIPEDSPAHNDLKRVLQAGEEASEFIQSIMTFCKPAKAGFSQFDLTALLYKTVNSIEMNLEKNLSINISRSNKALKINADINQIIFIITEIISNAQKSINSETGTISVSIEEVDSKKQAKISISDNGPGITPDKINKIFDPFFTTGKTESQGLGLATVYSYIQNSGGTILVESLPGGMTVFDIFLPIDDK